MAIPVGFSMMVSGDQTLRAIRDKIKLPVPTFRSSCAASAPTFHELRKVMGTGRLRETEFSVSVARGESEQNKPRDHDSDNEHPVLGIETQKGKVLDQKMQRPRAPIFGAT
jgi:hypothetical protein